MGDWGWVPVCVGVMIVVLPVAIYLCCSDHRRQVERPRLQELHAANWSRAHQLMNGDSENPDEQILLGPVSAWVAEGEAQAVRDWHKKYPPALPPSAAKWITVWHPTNGMDHQIPNDPRVLADFKTRGWLVRD